MTSKQIIDLHYEKNYKYYRKVCYRYYKGRYLYEDLLNESYLEFLKVKEDVVIKFNDIEKLHCLGLKIIRSLYQKRYQPAKNDYSGNGANSSPLFEGAVKLSLSDAFFENCRYEHDEPDKNINIKNWLYQQYVLSNESEKETQRQKEIELYFEKATIVIENALKCPVSESKERTPYQLVQTFLAVESSNINRISIETGISRPFITETHKKAKEYLKTEILK